MYTVQLSETRRVCTREEQIDTDSKVLQDDSGGPTYSFPYTSAKSVGTYSFNGFRQVYLRIILVKTIITEIVICTNVGGQTLHIYVVLALKLI